MPSSGYPMETFEHLTVNETTKLMQVIEENAEHALETGMFIEWLESFVGAYYYIKHTENPRRVREGVNPYTSGEAANIASQAGIIEWDM